jgi:Spx/MgsR family transcriptional regulator
LLCLFGINSCDRVVKAKKILSSAKVEFEYIDFRKGFFLTSHLADWLKKVTIDDVISLRSQAWKKLDQQQQQELLSSPNLQFIVDNPTLIKRPVLVTKDHIFFGFKQKIYEEAINNV